MFCFLLLLTNVFSYKLIAEKKCITKYTKEGRMNLNDCAETCKRKKCRLFSYDWNGHICYTTMKGKIEGTCNNESVYGSHECDWEYGFPRSRGGRYLAFRPDKNPYSDSMPDRETCLQAIIFFQERRPIQDGQKLNGVSFDRRDKRCYAVYGWDYVKTGPTEYSCKLRPEALKPDAEVEEEVASISGGYSASCRRGMVWSNVQKRCVNRRFSEGEVAAKYVARSYGDTTTPKDRPYMGPKAAAQAKQAVRNSVAVAKSDSVGTSKVVQVFALVGFIATVYGAGRYYLKN